MGSIRKSVHAGKPFEEVRIVSSDLTERPAGIPAEVEHRAEGGPGGPSGGLRPDGARLPERPAEGLATRVHVSRGRRPRGHPQR
jgi:hypothetical protein